ncbi:uncharacterized protein AB675_1268 [Cyphellophora attinorum]|uniref:CID domain-containing protein n=1 Tax=Cyphellophora attinorum TaxID=1664694 RepID=A0A0N1HI70_9EURO|nr:uncharacterized protein AB675_1268 [Phialophora attinorum]KPI35714.1 hypothetical protein AB675_1268 [Phialophora attinorum]
MSDGIEEDFRIALEELTTNDRYAISNLTLIAKEAVAAAESISRCLVNHINRAPPGRKLPALYLLDSISKNVGSPYTIYFGRNLYGVFMGAFSQVDDNVRRKLEEMLRTWREPVPGSTSTQPVFQLSATQTIVDNLNKLRASNPQRYPPPPQPRMPQFHPQRDTPTPPQQLPQRRRPKHRYGHPGYPPPPAVPQRYPPPPINHLPPTPQPLPPPPAPTVDLTALHRDIDDLTTDAKIECATHPMDIPAQKRLTTLQTLKEILDSNGASPSDLLSIRQSIDGQLEKKKQAAIAAALLPVPPPPPPALPAGLNSTNLADLLRAATGTPPVLPPPPVLPLPQAPAAPPAFSLLDQLKAAGLVSNAPTPLQALTPPAFPMSVEVSFTSASFKVHRPQMITSFLTARPNQCSTCGRRFTSDESGKERKARHLDSHFKTKARMIEAEKRGQNRSWYVDEREWLASREYDDAEEGTESAAPSPAKKVQDFVRAPTDPTLRSLPCPIDQETFKSEWDDGVQDWVWRDCIFVGGRYYHLSCYREVHRDRESTPVPRVGTPDVANSLPRKRKLEDA